jgi:hypothetical protein
MNNFIVVLALGLTVGADCCFAGSSQFVTRRHSGTPVSS